MSKTFLTEQPQSFTAEQKAQAQENLGVKDYYSTTREESELKYFSDIQSDYIWGLYDALMAKYPDKVHKNEIHNDDGTFTNHEYVISTGDYTTDGYYCELGAADPHIKKPKCLLSSGIHGNESATPLYLYRFVRDVLEGHNVPNAFREGAILHVLPVINPWGLDHSNRHNENGVDINRNFDWRWDEGTSDTKGTSPESEKETQAVVNWLKANVDAELWVDLHNSALMHELVSVLGSDKVDTAKKIAMRGIDKVIPYWKEVIGYPKYVESYEYVRDENGNYVVDENGEYRIEYVPKDLIYSYSATLPGYGCHYSYASNVLGLPAICLEVAAYNGDYLDWKDEKPISTENVAMGAEMLGNTLIEFYEESFANEVIDMTETSEKLDEILRSVKNGFRVEKGVFTVEEDLSGAQSLIVPGTAGAKIMVFEPDEATSAALLNTTGAPWVYAVVAQVIALLPYTRGDYLGYGSYITILDKGGAAGSTKNMSTEVKSLENGLQFTCAGIKAGTYNWTAYYWNE